MSNLSRNAYSRMTKEIMAVQTLSQTSAAVIPEALGIFTRTLFDVLISMRKSVTSIPIRPGMTSTGMKKLMKEDIVRTKVGMYKLYTNME